VASVPSAEREILRRVTVRGHLHATDEGVPALPVQAFEIQRDPFISGACSGCLRGLDRGA